MNNIKVIGMTGPSGSGKSSVAKIIASAGIAVIDADEIARYVTENNFSLLSELALNFGVTILDANGALNRKKLGQIVFGSRERLDRLNKIIFPSIIVEMERRVSALAKSGETMVVLDAPTLFESGADKLCDAVIAVTAEQNERLNRIMIRDRLSDEGARRRIGSQPDSQFYIDRANYSIENNGTPEALAAKTKELIKSLSGLMEGAI